MTITALVDRLCCPSYQPAAQPHPDPNVGILPPHLQGQILHAMAEIYLRGEPVAAAFNLLSALPAKAELRSEMIRRACNLLSVANQLTAGAQAVETEASLSLVIAHEGIHRLHGYCDCLITDRNGRVTVVDWKPGPRHDGLDVLQVKTYLAAVLTTRGLDQGDWVLYYYNTNGLRRRAASLQELTAELDQALDRAFLSGDLRPGAHCTGCLVRRECTVSV